MFAVDDLAAHENIAGNGAGHEHEWHVDSTRTLKYDSPLKRAVPQIKFVRVITVLSDILCEIAVCPVFNRASNGAVATAS